MQFPVVCPADHMEHRTPWTQHPNATELLVEPHVPTLHSVTHHKECVVLCYYELRLGLVLTVDNIHVEAPLLETGTSFTQLMTRYVDLSS